MGEFTNHELKELEKIKDSLILWLFDTKDKRYAIELYLKEAFLLGMKARK